MYQPKTEECSKWLLYLQQSGWKQPRQGENRQENAGSQEGSRPQAYKRDSEPRSMAEESEKARHATTKYQWREHKPGSWETERTRRNSGEQEH